MFGLGMDQRYFYYISAIDMRKGFDGLSGLVYYHMQEMYENKIVYAFVNKRRDKLKLLHWENGGFVLYYKRLEKGVFEFPKYDIEAGLIALSYTEMVMLLDGISIVNIKRNDRYLSTK